VLQNNSATDARFANGVSKNPGAQGLRRGGQELASVWRGFFGINLFNFLRGNCEFALE